MSTRFRSHRLAAVLVLVAAGAWVVTGKVSSVGSEEAAAAQPERTAATTGDTTSEAPALRTVAAITPVFSDHARAIRISGVTAADKNAVLAARASGVIARLDVEKGDRIEAGGEVMTIEGPDVLAAVTTAKAQRDQAKQQADIAERLYAGGNTSDVSLTAARATLAAAEAQLANAEVAADRLTLRAPFAGVVDDVTVERGEWVQTGKAIATLLALDPIVVRAEVSELDVGDLTPGATAEVRLVNGAVMKGTLRYVSHASSAQTRTYPVEVALPNPAGAIPAGMTAEVTLYAPAVRSVTVPRSIITLSEAGDLGLRVVDAENRAHFAAVTLIDDTPDGLILSGVPDGVRIIVAGQDLVSEGEEVTVEDVTGQDIGALK